MKEKIEILNAIRNYFVITEMETGDFYHLEIPIDRVFEYLDGEIDRLTKADALMLKNKMKHGLVAITLGENGEITSYKEMKK